MDDYTCAKCGTGLGNGAIDLCIIVNDLDHRRPGHIRTLRFCRDREEGGEQMQGCSRKILSSRNIKHYEESRAEDEAPAH